jgi:hypothetical protein
LALRLIDPARLKLDDRSDMVPGKTPIIPNTRARTARTVPLAVIFKNRSLRRNKVRFSLVIEKGRGLR